MQHITITLFTNYLLFFFLFGFISCGQKEDKTVLVATASSTFYAFQELEKIYEQESGENIALVKASSGILVTQILQGAPFDMFISADHSYAEKVCNGLQLAQKPIKLGENKLCLWKADEMLDLKKIASNQHQKIAIANPKTAPFGVLAINYLKQKGLYATLEDQFVFGNSISQVNHYILSEQVAFAFTSSSSSLVLGEGKEKLEECGGVPTLEQAILLLNTKKETQAFSDFLQSEKAIEILKKYGLR